MNWHSADEMMGELEERRSDRLIADHERRLRIARAAGMAERREHLLLVAAEKKAQRGKTSHFYFDEDLLELYLLELRRGATQIEAAELVGTTARTVQRYSQKTPAFARAVSEALVVRFENTPTHAVIQVIQRHRLFFGHCACGWRTPGRLTRKLAIEAVEQHARGSA